MESVWRERLLAARDAREDRDPKVGIADRCAGQGGLGSDTLHRGRSPVRDRACRVEHVSEIDPPALPDSGNNEGAGEGEHCVCAGQRRSLRGSCALLPIVSPARAGLMDLRSRND
jgi:hypothetical protein